MSIQYSRHVQRLWMRPWLQPSRWSRTTRANDPRWAPNLSTDEETVVGVVDRDETAGMSSVSSMLQTIMKWLDRLKGLWGNQPSSGSSATRRDPMLVGVQPGGVSTREMGCPKCWEPLEGLGTMAQNNISSTTHLPLFSVTPTQSRINRGAGGKKCQAHRR